jgi:hypothetical protein
MLAEWINEKLKLSSERTNKQKSKQKVQTKNEKFIRLLTNTQTAKIIG